MDRNSEESEEEIPEIKNYVFLYEDGKTNMVAVKSGIQDNTYIQSLSGVEEGDEVITGPYREVSRSLSNEEAVEKSKLFNKD
jgi:HlyD family secretion protein